MGWFIGAIILTILCCLGTAGYGYDLYVDIRFARTRRKHKILEDLMWFGYSAFCTAAALNLIYILWITRATW